MFFVEKLFIGVIFITFIALRNTKGNGWIESASTKNVLINGTIILTCTINSNFITSTFNSNNLSFAFVNDLINLKKVSEMKIVNTTSIKLIIPYAQLNYTGKYFCLANSSVYIANADVYVGYKPGKVENFKCRSYNWQKMICSFKEKFNPIINNYTLIYTYFDTDYVGNLKNNNNHGWQCTFQHYRRSYDYFTVDLTSNNEFGNFKETFLILQHDVVIPNPPEKDTIRYDNLTSSDATLYWNLSYKLETLPTEFIHQINITSEFSNGVWETVDLTNLKKVNHISYALQLQNLEYAHTWYNVRIRLKTIKAVDDDLWSNITSYFFRTASRIPDNPPKTNIGGFHINDYDDIVIYWKELSQSKQNGNDPHFRIDQVYENGRKIDKQPDEIKSTMAKFKAMPSYEYKIHVHSANSIGISTKASVVRIPSKNQRLSEPRRLKKIFNNGEYKIHWEPPLRNQNEIVNYTVFWCVTKSELPNQCESSIDFMQVQPDVLSYALNTTNTINFAISANSHNSSSGMVWALCTAAQSNDIGKIKTIWIPKMDATFMEIQWELECVDRSIVEGYNLTYCPISSPKTLECKEPEQSLNITGATLYNMTDLRPYTTYKTVISMFSKTRIGPPSEPLVITTLESSPSPPYLLRVTDITNVSCVVHWEPPENLNGVLMYYEIWFNQIRIKLDNEKRDATEMSFLYSKLDSYTSYTILVVACTVGCSSASNKVTVKTKIGVPGPIEQPVYNIRESDENPNTMLVISWEPPAVPFGKLDFYELKTVFKKNNKLEEKINRIKSTYCSLKYAVCQDDYENYQFSVRAVNLKYTISLEDGIQSELTNKDIIQLKSTPLDIPLIPKNNFQCVEAEDESLSNILERNHFAECLYGNWSNASTHGCHYRNKEQNLAIIKVTASCLIVFLIILVLFLGLKKLKRMKDFDIELPSGLVETEDINKVPFNLEYSNNDKTIRLYDEQEQNLLETFISRNSTVSGDTNSSFEFTDDVFLDQDYLENSMNANITVPESEQDSIEMRTNIPNDEINFKPVKSNEIMENGYIPLSLLSKQTFKGNDKLSKNPSRDYIQFVDLQLKKLPPEGYVTTKELENFAQHAIK